MSNRLLQGLTSLPSKPVAFKSKAPVKLQSYSIYMRWQIERMN
jgi:hypothetical protein